MTTAVITRRAIVELGVRGALQDCQVETAPCLAALRGQDGCSLVLMDLLSCSEADLDDALVVSNDVPVVVLVEWDAPQRLPQVGHLGQLALSSRMRTVRRFVKQVAMMCDAGYISESEITPARRARLTASPLAEAPSFP